MTACLDDFDGFDLRYSRHQRGADRPPSRFASQAVVLHQPSQA